MSDEKVIIAVQVYDGVVVVEWTMLEWIGELVLMKLDGTATLDYIYRLGIRETDNFKGKDLLDV